LLKTLETRSALESHGRSMASAKISDYADDVYTCRMLGRFSVLISATDEGLFPCREDGFWEAWISLWMLRNVNYQDKCADIGANIGYYTYLMAEIGATVDAYEPNPDVFELLAQALLENGNPPGIKLYNEAVGSENGEVTFTVPPNNPMNGSLDGKAVGDDILVQVSNRVGLESYDFIKIDIEGGELDFFKILDHDKHPLVLMEFRWDRYDDPITFSQDIFKKYNYVYYVDNEGNEVKLDKAHDLSRREHEDWMLVLRRKRKEIA
jgi:FkbM family methyltransferase